MNNKVLYNHQINELKPLTIDEMKEIKGGWIMWVGAAIIIAAAAYVGYKEGCHCK